MARIFPAIAVLCIALFSASVAGAQDYPSKPIRMLGPEAGGGADFLARLVAQGMSVGLNQPVIVDPRAGSVAIPVDVLVNAPPDGYTILFYSNSVWLQPYLQDVKYDPLRDLIPVSLAVSSPNVLAVNPSLPVTSVAELIELAKSKPGVLNFSAGAIGSANHLAGELFKSMAGVNLTFVPFRGAGPATTAALSGEVQILFATATTVIPLAEAGSLRALGITSAKPSELAPKLPTVATTVPGYDANVSFAIFVAAKTPKAIVDRLNKAIVDFVKSPDAKERLFKAGAEPVGNSPEEVSALIKADMARMSKVIKDSGLKIN